MDPWPHVKAYYARALERPAWQRTLAAYAEHPNVAGVVFIGLGCEKTNLTVMEKYLNDQHRPLNKPVARIGIQDAGGGG